MIGYFAMIIAFLLFMMLVLHELHVKKYKRLEIEKEFYREKAQKLTAMKEDLESHFGI
jgi:hypothetical protein